MSTTPAEPSTIHVRFLHFLSLVLMALSTLFVAYSFYACEMKDYSDHPTVKAVSSSWDAAYEAKKILQHREMTDLTQISLFWAGLALVGVVFSLSSYYVIKGSVRPGDRKTYDKAFTLYVFCVLLPLAAAFLMYNNMPYISRS